jgi:hypothetical protein
MATVMMDIGQCFNDRQGRALALAVLARLVAPVPHDEVQLMVDVEDQP